ncbi:c-type cytochrome [Pseudomonas sp. zfem005]|uniref:c-type cytochrome n=1 Tax=Pseudomonas sp. zfem005 TaxID=3078200 RepID=UPI0029296338|nr:c-type cytochrome [Pseudomonas sp. zfem005]MDU9414458.1 c-type cytochrome [Pseudomonas sp. zfem005]
MKVSLFTGALLLAATLHAQAEAIPIQAFNCTACHGGQGQGNALLGAPRLAGQQAEYLLDQLRHFKAGRRGYDARDLHGAQMRGVVASMEERDFEPLARYFSGLEVTADEVPPAADASRGEALYQGTCAACHGPAGQGFAHLRTPNLSLLDAAYLERQLTHYVQGVRGGEAHADELGLWMRGISLQIGEGAERQAIVDYIGSLRGGS